MFFLFFNVKKKEPSIYFRSEIAWREAKYAQIYEYLREEYEVTQRFGNLDYKLKFVEVTFLSLK